MAVGGVILLTNSRTLFNSFDASGSVRWPVYAAIVLVVIIGIYVAIQRTRRARADAADEKVVESIDA